MWPFNTTEANKTVAPHAPRKNPSRLYLKIKIMSLAAEAKIIRAEEKRWPGPSDQRTGLHHHRVIDVRRESRSACLAYGFLRGRTYRRMEAKAHETPDWKRIQTIIEKFGDMSAADTKNLFAAWRKEAEAA